MSDIDKDLKRRLAAFADQISPEPGRSALVARSARRKRRLVALSAGVAVLLAIGGLAGAATLLGNRDGIKPAPGPDVMAAARYFFEVGSRDASASGVLAVNPQEGTLCYEATTENIQASHLLRNTGVVAGGRRFERAIVVTFFDADDGEQGAELSSGAPICFQEEQLGALEGGLQALIDHPEEFRIDFHRGPEDEPGLIAELTPHREGGVDCPVTTPSGSAFVPPEPYPPRPPDLYQKEWYGSARLWTWIGSNGEVWEDLPDEDGDGKFSEKTFWWSQPVGNRRLAPITVRGRRLDGPGSFRTRAPGGGGFREDIGSFMLVGIEIPAGCWELTGTHRGAELSYVVLVKDQP